MHTHECTHARTHARTQEAERKLKNQLESQNEELFQVETLFWFLLQRCALCIVHCASPWGRPCSHGPDGPDGVHRLLAPIACTPHRMKPACLQPAASMAFSSHGLHRTWPAGPMS